MSQTQPTAGPSQLSIEEILEWIENSTDDLKLNDTLKDCTASTEQREKLFASLKDDGQDPLLSLHMQDHTLGCLYLLSARLTVTTPAVPSIEIIRQFCSEFDPIKARLAPERVSLLAEGIFTLSKESNTMDQCIPVLYTLLTRYPPSLNYLTSIHQYFARACVSQRQFTTLLPILQKPITEIDTSINHISYDDNLVYHYVGGMAFAALNRWTAAEDFFDIVISSPAQHSSAIQLEALKKLALVQLILYGKVKDVPKYVLPTIINIFKKSPYGTFVINYPLQMDQLEKLLEKETNFFKSDQNLGLVRLALKKARRWAIKKLTETYITLNLSDIGKEVGITDNNEVRSIIDSMVEEGEIRATISDDGFVTFDDIPISFTKEQVDTLLYNARLQDAILYKLDKKMERSREFLCKGLKKSDGQEWAQMGDEDMFSKPSDWSEEPMY